MAQFLVHDNTGIQLMNGSPTFDKLPNIENVNGKAKAVAIAENGKRMAWICNGEIKVFDGPSWKRIGNLNHPKAQEISFSPQGNYLSVYDIYGKTADGTSQPNLSIYNVTGRKLLKTLFQQSQINWEPQWTKDESIMARMVTSEVHFYKSDDLDNYEKKKVLAKVKSFKISPSIRNHNCIFFVPGSKDIPAFVYLHKYSELTTLPVASKSFFNIESVEVFWNANCSAALILTTSEATKGSSYYGQQMVFYLNTRGDSNRVTFSKEGNIRSLSWSKSGSEFFCVYGSAPSRTTLFNHKGDAVKEFGVGAHNLVMPNPVGNIVLVGGLGNIASRFETWDIAEQKCIGKVDFPDITHISWSSCGQYILTSTCSPRLRVSNGYKVWHYSAVLIHEKLMDDGELYKAAWITDDSLSKDFPISYKLVNGIQSTVKTASKERYIPPSQRAAVAAVGGKLNTEKRYLSQREDQLKGNDVSEKTKTKKVAITKKKEEQKKKKEEKKGIDKDWRNENTTSVEPPPNSHKLNRIKNIKKKLQNIKDIKKNIEEGKDVPDKMKEKVATEENLLKELEKLSV